MEGGFGKPKDFDRRIRETMTLGGYGASEDLPKGNHGRGGRRGIWETHGLWEGFAEGNNDLGRIRGLGASQKKTVIEGGSGKLRDFGRILQKETMI